MDKKINMLVATIALSLLSLVGVAITKLTSGSAPATEKQLTQEQRLNALQNLSPQSSTVRRMVAGEKANEEAQKEIEQPGK